MIVSAISLFSQGIEGKNVVLQAGRRDRVLQMAGSSTAPVIGPGSLVHSASQKGDMPVAPGTLVSIYGSNLAFENEKPIVLLGGQPLPVLFSNSEQINAQVPFALLVNTAHQVVVRRGEMLSVPETFVVASAQPGIFSVDQSGTGQGVVIGADERSIADKANPAERGKPIVIYCTGLGAVVPVGEFGKPAPTEVLFATTAEVQVAVGGKPAAVHFSGLTPGFIGLYQVNALIPTDTATGDSIPLSIASQGQTSNTVTIGVR